MSEQEKCPKCHRVGCRRWENERLGYRLDSFAGFHDQNCQLAAANATIETLRPDGKCEHCGDWLVRAKDGTLGCLLCVAKEAQDLAEELAEEKARAERAEADVERLRKSNEAWQTSPRTWHRCPNGAVRPYPALLCSMCRPGEGKDFDALDALREVERKLAAIAHRASLSSKYGNILAHEIRTILASETPQPVVETWCDKCGCKYNPNDHPGGCPECSNLRGRSPGDCEPKPDTVALTVTREWIERAKRATAWPDTRPVESQWITMFKLVCQALASQGGRVEP